MKLRDKIAIVTGAGDGIGRGIAVRFAAEGADLAICDINSQAMLETQRQIQHSGRRCHATCFDIRDASSIERFVRETARQLGGVDVLVNNAAIMPVARTEELTQDVVNQVLQVNLGAPILFSRYVIDEMKKRGGGSIIHMGSVTGHNGHPGVTVYGATKGALMALARGQAMELASLHIRVNTVSPGTVDSPMLHRFLAENSNDPEKARRSFDRVHPRGQIASIDEIASVFVFLACDDSANITAADIRCDGGYCVQGVQPTS
jgi:NAD(P)-dependent dehydrogenase (short-subunit alcohol dehydrogenase family)